MNETSLDDYYADQQSTFEEVLAVVRGKMAAKKPMTTAKEELIEDFVRQWVDAFGYETL